MRNSKKFAPQSKAALGRYLAAGLGATGLASMECEAAIVTLNVASLGTPARNFTGINAGITAGPSGVKSTNNLFPSSISVGNLFAYNTTGQYGIKGIGGFGGLEFAIPAPYSYEPRQFLAGEQIGPAVVDWSPFGQQSTPFQANYTGVTLPSWGRSSMGFRAYRGDTPGVNYYGYFEVTWDSTLEQFRIYSGAYESTLNTPITAVPEPSTIALTGIGALALGAGVIRKSRKARKAAAEGSLAEAV